MIMKNLVKQAKSNNWKLIVYSIYIFITSFYILFRILNINYWEIKDNLSMVVLFWMMIVCFAMVSAMISLFVSISIKDNIWKKAKKFRNDLILNRHIHHLRMMEKYIELGDKEKSELLYNQYIESKYWDQNSASFFEGAIKAKFHKKLDFKITYNGKEL